MRKLFEFLYRNRSLLLFLVLELICFRMIVRSHSYQEAHFLNTSNAVAASVLEFSRTSDNYFGLREINESLALENARLRKQLSAYAEGTVVLPDSNRVMPYAFVTARVIDNTTGLSRNFITINKGRADGVEVGMAVVGQVGIVGKVKAVSEHYAVIISLLNIDEHVSVQLTRTGNFGTLRWDGENPAYAKLLYLPRHASVWAGDTLVTSGYNAVFPARMPVGVIRKAELSSDAMFYDVVVELAQDFSRLRYVDVIQSRNAAEIDSLQQTIQKP